VRWPVTAGERTGSLELNTATNVSDRIEIWVNNEGNPVAPPTPTWHAVGDALRGRVSDMAGLHRLVEVLLE
jgi:hypothetical protein